MVKRISPQAAEKTRQQLAGAWQLMQAGQPEAAEKALRAILRRVPRDADALGLIGALMLQQGRAAEAVVALQRAVGARPGDAAALYNLGCALATAGQPREAAAALRRSLDHDPAPPEGWVNLGNVLQELDDRTAALDCYREALRRAPDLVEPRNNMGAALLYEGRLDEAETVLREAVTLKPGYAAAWNNLGSVLKSKGDLDGAADALKHALDAEPGMGEALANLVDIDPLAGSGEDAERLAALAADTTIPAGDRIAAGFAAGRMLAKRNRHDEAFAAYAQGNAARHALDRARGHGFDPIAHRQMVNALIETFDADRLAAQPPCLDADRTPVFILGMPRSGTTLAEQILSSHPDVAGGGEVPFLAEAVDHAGGPLAPATLPADELRRIGAGYLAQLRAVAPENVMHVTDKTPTNFLHIGAIALMLPGARIVHCRREAADTCLSCFFQNFGRGNVFTNDLGELGAYYRDYRRLIDHWRALLPSMIHTIDYEILVTDPEPAIRDLLSFLGLGWDPRCLAFHENPRAVLTASNAQVRRRLYNSSVARWKPYATHLAPLFAALGEAAPSQE